MHLFPVKDASPSAAQYESCCLGQRSVLTPVPLFQQYFLFTDNTREKWKSLKQLSPWQTQAREINGKRIMWGLSRVGPLDTMVIMY